MSLLMATTIQETLEGAIAKEFEDGNMEFTGLKGTAALARFQQGDLNYGSLDYGYVEVVGDGERQ